MPPEMDEESLRILRYLQGDGTAAEPADAAGIMIDTTSMIKANDDRETALRVLGLNRREREQTSRRRRPATPHNPERDKTTATKRIAHYIDCQVDWSTTDLSRSDVIAAWAALAKYDVDVANRWWSQGVHPLRVREVTDLIGRGFEPTDLFEVINGKTIIRHLDEGTSIEWCTHALRWNRRTSR